MNNSTRNFTNSSNAQNSSSFKDKLRKLTTGVALAGTLLMGTACENKGSTTADQQKDKVENVQTDIQQANRENEGSENDDAEYDRAILEIELEMENEQITRDSIRLVEEIKKIDEDAERIAKDRERIAKDAERIAKDAERIAKDRERIAKDRERIAKDAERIAKNRKNARAEMEALWASVDAEVFKSSKEVQDALDEYFQWAKENWYEPIPHAKYLASLKK